MTDGSGSTPPTGLRLNLPLSREDGQSARIVRLPDALENVARAQRVEGEVVRQNPDGTVRIRTDKGDIDVLLRGRQPQPGQQVEVDIPSGRPPRQVVIRSAPAPSPDTSSPNTPRASGSTSAPPPSSGTTQTPSSPPAAASTPARGQPAAAPAPQGQQTQVQPPLPPAPASSAQTTPAPRVTPAALPDLASQPPAPVTPAVQAPLEPGQAVRLIPLPPGQAADIKVVSLPVIPVQLVVVTRAAFTANIIAQNVQSDLQTAVLQTKPLALATLPQPVAVSLSAKTVSAPILQFTQPLLTQTLSQPASFVPPESGKFFVQTTPLPSIPATQVVPYLQLATKIPPLEPLLSNAVPAAIKSLPLDVRVQQVLPAQAQLVSLTGDIKTPVTPLLFTPPTPSLPPAINSSPLLTQTPLQVLTAQVTGFTPQNLPVVTIVPPGAPSASAPSFVMQFAASNLPAGSQIQIVSPTVIQPGTPATVLPSPVNTGAVPTPVPPVSVPLLPLPSLLTPGPWSVMEEIYQALSQSSAQVAQTLARAMPSPATPSQIGAAALLFIAAVKSGDLSSWLGDRRIDLLQRIGKGDLVSRLNGDGATLTRAAAEPLSGGDWRAVPLPIYWQDEIHRVTLYTRQDQQERDKENSEGQTRFIFDLTLSQMGDVQLDGLLRGKRLDLVVRTQNPFSVSMQQAMRGAYSRALEDTSLTGDLSFQGDPRQWVHVLKKEETLGVNA